jgi:hypothetical protein
MWRQRKRMRGRQRERQRQRQGDFKKLAHMVLEADKSQIYWDM